MWSRNLVNEEALVHWGLLRQKQTKSWMSCVRIRIFPFDFFYTPKLAVFLSGPSEEFFYFSHWTYFAGALYLDIQHAVLHLTWRSFNSRTVKFSSVLQLPMLELLKCRICMWTVTLSFRDIHWVLCEISKKGSRRPSYPPNSAISLPFKGEYFETSLRSEIFWHKHGNIT